MSVPESKNWSPSYQGGSKAGVIPTGHSKEYSTYLNSNPKDYSYSLDENRNLVKHKIDRSDLGTGGARREQIKLKKSSGSSTSNTNTPKNNPNKNSGSGDSSGGGGYDDYSGGGSSSGGSSGSGKTTKVKKTAIKSVIGTTGASAGVAIGLNTSRIVAIETALDAYIKAVTSAIHVASSKKNVALAIKGAAAQVEVRKYIASMDKACEQLFRDLDKYKKILEQMKSNYTSNDKFNNSVSSGSGTSFAAKTATKLTNFLNK